MGVPGKYLYTYFGGSRLSDFEVAVKNVLPSDLAPAGTWDNLYKKIVAAHVRRPNLFTVDGLRSVHFVLAYGRYKPNRVQGGTSKEQWNATRREVMQWCEQSIGELIH